MFRKKFTAAAAALIIVALGLNSCTDEKVPGFDFMPDMYYGPSIQAYEPNALFVDSLSARLPAEGSVPRGFMAYQAYPPGPEGYEAAKSQLQMPAQIPSDSVTLAEGAKLYGIYCAICHGTDGKGQGALVTNEVFLGVPSYADREITMGSVFHVVTYGKGVMGSHASQVTPEERWKISQHVMKLRAELTGSADTATAEGIEEASEEEMENTENNQGSTE